MKPKTRDQRAGSWTANHELWALDDNQAGQLYPITISFHYVREGIKIRSFEAFCEGKRVTRINQFRDLVWTTKQRFRLQLRGTYPPPICEIPQEIWNTPHFTKGT